MTLSVNMGSKRIYIQAAYDIPNKEKMSQETKSFKLINDSFAKIVIIKGRFAPTFDENGILYIGLYDFLEKDILLEL